METTSWTETAKGDTSWGNGYPQQSYLMNDTVALINDTVATMDGYSVTPLIPVISNTIWT
jgi:hypothetical protein